MEERKPLARKVLDHPVLSCFLFFIISMALVNALQAFFGLFWDPDAPIVGDVLSLAASALPAVALALLVKWQLGGDFQLGFHGRQLRQCLTLLLVMIVPHVLFYSLAAFAAGPVTLKMVFLSLLAGLEPGLDEEILFRSLTLGNLERCWRGRKDMIPRAVLTSAALFGIIHLFNLVYGAILGTDMANAIPQVCNQVVYAFAIGILLGAVYMRTRNAWGLVIAHSLYDAATNLLISAQNGTNTEVVGSIISNEFTWVNLIPTLVMLVVFGGFGLYLIRPSKHPEILSLSPGGPLPCAEAGEYDV